MDSMRKLLELDLSWIDAWRYTHGNFRDIHGIAQREMVSY